jgi:hypothetical protein
MALLCGVASTTSAYGSPTLLENVRGYTLVGERVH